MNTRKYPRTLNEAFGPYTDNTIYEPEPYDYEYPAAWWCALTTVAILALGVIWATA